MTNVIPFPKKVPDHISIDGGWLKGYPIGGAAGQYYVVIYHYGDEFWDVIWDGESYDAAMTVALGEAKNGGLHVCDLVRGRQ